MIPPRAPLFMSRQHHAAVITGPRRVSIEKQALPPCGPHQIRVQLEGCGVCGSNLPVWEGRPWFTYPLAGGAPGHEGWGRVDAIGAEVDSILAVGDRVAALSFNAYAEYDVADAAQVVKLPPELRDQPFPGEALGCALNIFRRCHIEPGEHVAVVGVGFIGALLVNLAARAGAHVYALTRRPFALELATRLGAEAALPFGDRGTLVQQVRDLSGGAGCTCVIEATGFQEPLDLATELTAERGRLVIAGYHQDGLRQVNMQLWNWRGLDVINAHERDPRIYVQGMREAVEAVASGRLDPSPLYTHRFPLDALDRALDGMGARDGGFMKALITYA